MLLKSILEMLLAFLRVLSGHSDKRRTMGEFLQCLLLILTLGVLAALILAVSGLIYLFWSVLSS